MMLIETYIDATRRSLPTRLQPVIYTPHISIANEIIDHNDLAAKIFLCYTSERRAETLKTSEGTVIFYDQYLGQTLSNLSRIVHEKSTTEHAINYISKIVAEFFRAYGCTREAFAFARIHSVEANHLKHVPKEPERLLKTAFQEQFLLLHEVFHVSIAQRPEMRRHVDEMLDDYFESRKNALEITAGLDLSELLDKLDLLPAGISENIKKDAKQVDSVMLDYPKKKEVPKFVLDEMACDYFSWVAVTHFAEQYNPFPEINTKRLATIDCLEAIKNVELINTLRNSVKSYSRSDTLNNRGESSDDFVAKNERRSDVIRARFVNWLINIHNDSEEWSRGLTLEIDKYYNDYHDKLAIVGNTIAESISQKKVDKLFEDDFKFVDSYSGLNEMSLVECNAVVDIITGWHELENSDPIVKIISEINKYKRGKSHIIFR